MKNQYPHDITLENFVGEVSARVISQLQAEFNSGTAELAYANKVQKILNQASKEITAAKSSARGA